MQKTREIVTKEKANIKWENEYYILKLFYLENILDLPLKNDLLTIKIEPKGDYLPIEFSINCIYENEYEMYTDLTSVRFMSQDNKKDILNKISIAEKSMDEIEKCITPYFPVK